MIDMAEPKLLPPSLRSHKRYIIFEIISDNPATYSDLVNAIWNSMLNFLGELESSEAMLWLIQNLYDPSLALLIIKVLDQP